MAINWCDVLGFGPMHLQELKFSGYTYLKEGKYAIAKVFFDALTVLEPEIAYNKRALGAILILLGDYKQAVEVLQDAITLEPDHEGARLNRAKALLFSGNKDEGLQAAKELVSSKDSETAKDAQALILAYEA